MNLASFNNEAKMRERLRCLEQVLWMKDDRLCECNSLLILGKRDVCWIRDHC